MKPTVYIETTIAGYLTSRLPRDIVVAGQMLETRRWWQESSDQFELQTLGKCRDAGKNRAGLQIVGFCGTRHLHAERTAKMIVRQT
jgi:hypothetical protein